MNPFNPEKWDTVAGFNFTDITYHRAKDQGTVRIAFNRPDCLNSFRPQTVDELYIALDHARQSSDVGCVLLTGNGPSSKHGKWSFSQEAIRESEEKMVISIKQIQERLIVQNLVVFIF